MRKSGNCIPIVSFIRKDRKRGNRKSIYCQSFGAKKMPQMLAYLT